MNNNEERPFMEGSAEFDEPQQVGAGIDYTDPNSALARYYVRTSHILFAALLVIVFLNFGVFTPLGHTDIWGHLKYGEWIVNNRTLPKNEPFSLFSDQTQPYWNFQWLSHVLLYLTYHAGEVLVGGDELRRTAGGVEMLRSLHGILLAMKFAFLSLAVCRSTRSLPLALAGAILLFVLTMSPSRIQRPQVFAEVLFAILIWWVSAPRLARATWLIVPALFVVWANFHGSFAVGYLVFALFCFGRVLEDYWTQPNIAQSVWQSSWLRQGLMSLVLAPIAIGVLNPHGFGVYSNILQLSQHPNLRTLSEWMPMDFNQAQGGHLLYFVLMLLVVGSQAVSPRPLPLSRMLVLLALALGSLYQQRILVWLIMITPWIIAPLAKHAMVYLPRAWLRIRSVPSLRKTMIVAAFVLIGFSWSGLCQIITGRDPLPLETSTTHATLWSFAYVLKNDGHVPAFRPNPDGSDSKLKVATHRLAGAIKSYPQQRFQGRVFVQDSLSDYLLWSPPNADSQLLFYNHAHLFPEELWQHQITILTAKPGWTSLVDRYQINLIVFDPLAWPDLAEKLRTDHAWNVVFDEGDANRVLQSSAVHDMKLFVAVRKRPV